MTPDVKVSIIVPVYNAGDRLKVCVNSILSQTLNDIELILVDDGSTDGSGELCDVLASDCRVKVVHKENSGPGEARNAGIAEARGEFIGFADADDCLDPGMYQALYDAAVSTDSDLTFCDYIFCTKHGNHTIKSDFRGDRTFDKKEIANEILPYFFGYESNELNNYKNLCPFADYCSYLWLGLYRASVIKKYNLRLLNQKEYYNEDHLFNLNFVIHSNRITHLAKPLYFYHDNSDSLTKRFYREFLDAKLRKYAYLFDFIKKNNCDAAFLTRLYNKICIESISIINYYVSVKELNLKEKYKKIAETLNSRIISDAFDRLDLKPIRLSKLFIFLYIEKHKLYLPALALSICYNMLKN